jgi:hypothetical protein
MNNGTEVDEQLVNNEKMASYSQVVSGNNHQDKNQDTDDTNEHNNQFPKQGYTQSHYRESENVKPIFLKDEDVFGSRKPERSLWLTNVEIYKAIGDKVQAQCIKGIQRVREMWRIYMDNEEDRQSLLVQGINPQLGSTTPFFHCLQVVRQLQCHYSSVAHLAILE